MSLLNRLPWRKSADATHSDETPDQGTAEALLQALLRDRRQERSNKTLRAFVYFAIFGIPTILYGGVMLKASGWAPFSREDVVGIVHIDGPISPDAKASADRIIPALRRAFEAERVKAVVLSIDSGGGAPLESERIYRAIHQLRQQHPKPVVAVINNFGASAAYMIALHTDRIYAGKYSLVGSIGAVMTGWDVHKALEKYDVQHRVYASGSLKAMLNPYVAMSPEADHKAQGLVEEMGSQFVAEVKALRGKSLKPQVDYGTGEAWVGQAAKDIGLVDELNTIDQVVKARWDMPMKDFGPKDVQMPFIGASSEWLSDVIAKAMARVSASSQQVSVR